MADAHRGGAFELGAVGHQDDVASIGNDCLRHFHFAEIEIQKRAISVDGRGADDRVVHFELPDEIDRCFSDDAAVRAATTPPAMTTSIDGKMRNLLRNVDVIGDDHQFVVAQTEPATAASLVVPILMKREVLQE